MIELALPRVPPSINTNAVRSHWRGFHSAKKKWQADLEVLLLAARLPRPIPASGPVLVDVVLRFPDRRRRDSENFRPVLSKALGDALVNGGWLHDDTDEDWRLQVVRDLEPGPARTLITVRWEEVKAVAA
jgi:Holliday junction resolvase RusA-like endonuclease